MFRIRRFGVVKTANVIASLYVVLIAIFVPFGMAFVAVAPNSGAFGNLGVVEILFFGLLPDDHVLLLRTGTIGRLTGRTVTRTLSRIRQRVGHHPVDISRCQMSRISRRLSAALGLIAVTVLTLSSCSGAALPELTDAKAIITAALKATETARSVHLDVTVDGSINADLFGTGDTKASFALTGTTASADVDITGGNARATFAVPALLGLTGELIQIGETSYLKTSLGGPLFETQETTDSLPIDPSNPTAMVDDLGDFLLKDGVDPIKGEDVECGTVKCYAVTIELTAEELAALDPTGAATDELPIDVGAASLNLTITVEKDTYHLAGITAVVSLGEDDSVTVELTLSNWDAAIEISPPPADQLAPAA